jgi:PhnB protein
VPAEWRNKIIHTRLRVGDRLLMASDTPPDRFDQPKGFSVDRRRRYGRRGGAYL